METTRFVYVGYPDSTGTDDAPNWKLIQDAPGEIQRAIAQGYTAKTILSLDHEPVKGKEPRRYGPIVLDFDYKEDPNLAIRAAQIFVVRLCELYNLNPNSLRYWISGYKGCHIEIPASLIGSEDGSPILAQIYKYMTKVLYTQCLRSSSGYWKMLDMGMFCGGKGRLLRIENIQRPNGRYKVPVTAEEFLNVAPQELMVLTEHQRLDLDSGHVTGIRSDNLHILYRTMKEIFEPHSKEKQIEILDALNKCAFLNHCVEDADTLSEPEWWAFVSILAPLGKMGDKLIHIFSRPYPGYSSSETSAKIAKARTENKPKTCSFIRQQGWVVCSESCNQYCPCNLFGNNTRQQKESMFYHGSDGLYYNEGERPIKVCSPLKVIGIPCGFDNFSWGRLVEIVDLLQNKKQIILKMKEIHDQGKWLAKLVDAGLVLGIFRNSRKLLQEYLINGENDVEFVRLMDKIGWTPAGDYLLPDTCYGDNERTIYSGRENTKFNIAGTLED